MQFTTAILPFLALASLVTAETIIESGFVENDITITFWTGKEGEGSSETLTMANNKCVNLQLLVGRARSVIKPRGRFSPGSNRAVSCTFFQFGGCNGDKYTLGPEKTMDADLGSQLKSSVRCNFATITS